MPDSRTMEELMVALDPHLDEIDEICRFGVNTYAKRYDAELRVAHSKSLAAHTIYDHMADEAYRRFLDRPGIMPLDVRGLRVWLFGSEIVLRFKKMDPSGRFRRISTPQANAYDNAEANAYDDQDDLPGIPLAAARLVAGYLPDPTGTSVVRSQIARPIKSGRLSWCVGIVPLDERQADQSKWFEVTGQLNLA